MTDRPYLHLLAERLGIVGHYHGYDGSERRTRDDTRIALLAAMGFDASTERRAQEAVHALAHEDAQPGLDPVRVLPRGSPDLLHVTLRVPASSPSELSCRVELTPEDAAPRVWTGSRRHEGGTLELPLEGGTALAPGYHALTCEVGLSDAVLRCEQSVIVTPPACFSPDDALSGRPALGLWTHLYAVRSALSAGIGDLGDLTRLCAWAGELGVDFVGINPLHDTDLGASEVSPYFPRSRLYGSPLYLDLPAALARVGSPELMARLAEPGLAAARAELAASARTEYARAAALKRPLLEAAHGAFIRMHRGRDTPLDRSYTAYLREQGDTLRHFALFSALQEHLASADPGRSQLASWPLELRSADSPAVQRFAREHADAIDFHAYLQHELSLQLAECQRGARAAGMRVGLYGDLALGDAPCSAELWARPELYAKGVSLGAPPDAYADDGQSWGLLPLSPRALRRDRHRHVRALLRQALRHVGAVRIDHVMGMQRQFWVPRGGSARDGAYVRFPLSDLLGIVALESQRARALIIGEDLGLVEAGLREELARRGVLRSQVLIFERGADGALLAPGGYARNALLSVGTHDLAPLLGHLRGRDLELRARAGAFRDETSRDAAFAERERFARELIELLRSLQLLPKGPQEPEPQAIVAATCSLLARSSAQLVAIALDDLTLEREPLNTPGVSLAEAPNWTRRTSLTLEQLMGDARIRRWLTELRAERERAT